MIQRTLSNGLQVILVEDHWHPLVVLEVCYWAGSRYDPPGKQGLAHLLEHLTFRSLGLPQTEDVIPSARAGRASATTAHDTTCYSSQLLRPELEHALAAEAARMATLQVSAEALAHEKIIVAHERRQLVEGDTWRNLLEEVDAVAFRVHPYRFPTSGWAETLAQISLDDVRHHFTAYYSPANAILAAVGDFQRQDLLPRIEARFGHIPARPLPPPAMVVEPAQDGERRLLLAPLAAPRLVAAYHVPAFRDHKEAALQVTAALLAGGEEARLPARFYPRQLAEAVGVEYNSLTRDPGLFYIKVALGPRVDFRLTGAAIDDVLWRLREDGPSPRELAQTKKRLLLEVYLEDALMTRATRLAQCGLLAASPCVQRYTDDLQAVTAAEVQQVVRDYFSPERRVVGMTGAAQQAGVRPPHGATR